MRINRAIRLVILLFVLLTSCKSEPAVSQKGETSVQIQTEDTWVPGISYLSLLTVDFTPGKWYNVNSDEILLKVAFGSKNTPALLRKMDYALLEVYEYPENLRFDYETLATKESEREAKLIRSFRIDSYYDYPDPVSKYNSEDKEWEHTLPVNIDLSFFGSELDENYGGLYFILRVFNSENRIITNYNCVENIYFIKSKDNITFLRPDEYIKYKINIYGRG